MDGTDAPPLVASNTSPVPVDASATVTVEVAADPSVTVNAVETAATVPDDGPLIVAVVGPNDPAIAPTFVTAFVSPE